MRDAVLSNITFYAWSQAPRTIESLAAYSGSDLTVQLPEGAARMPAASVTPGLLPAIRGTRRGGVGAIATGTGGLSSGGAGGHSRRR
jgi:hypothetical protein